MRRRSKYLWGVAAALCLLAIPVCRWQNDGLMLTRYTAALPGLPATGAPSGCASGARR